MKKLLTVCVLCLAMLTFFNGCKKEVQTEPEPQPVVEKVEEQAPQPEQPKLTEEEIFMQKTLDQINSEGHLKMIHFDFDKYFIREDMKPILQKNSEWLLNHQSVEIVVEGHCDERGTVEYNMALGEKRAEAAMKYLESLGVPSERMRIISYGKNRPLVKGVDEDSHFMNRRGEFKVVKK